MIINQKNRIRNIFVVLFVVFVFLFPIYEVLAAEGCCTPDRGGCKWGSEDECTEIFIPSSNNACSKEKCTNLQKQYEEQIESGIATPPVVELEVPFGETNKVTGISGYIVVLYEYMILLTSFAAVVMVIFGGFKWATAAGNSGQIASAKTTITSALIGLILALTSYLLLYTINPALVDSDQLAIPQIVFETEDDNCYMSHYGKGIDADCEEGYKIEDTECGQNCTFSEGFCKGFCSNMYSCQLAYIGGMTGVYLDEQYALGYIQVQRSFCDFDLDTEGLCLCRFNNEPNWLKGMPDFVNYKLDKNDSCFYDWQCKSDACNMLCQ